MNHGGDSTASLNQRLSNSLSFREIMAETEDLSERQQAILDDHVLEKLMENEALHRRVLELEAQLSAGISGPSSSYSEMQSELQRLRGENAMLRDAVTGRTMGKATTDLRLEYQKTLEKYQGDWARERDTILAERDQYMNECKRLMSNPPQQQEDGESVAELRARCETLSNQLEVLGQELAKTRTSSQESKILKEKYDGEVAQLEAKMQNDMALIIMDRDKARQEADALEEKINELERAAAGFEAAKKAAEEEAAHASERAAILDGKLKMHEADAAARVEALTTELAELHAHVETSKQEAELYRSKVTDKDTVVETLEKQNRELRFELREMEEKINQLAAVVQSSSSASSAEAQEAAMLREMLEEAQKEARQNRIDLDAAMHAFEKRNSEHGSTVEALENQIGALTASVREAEADITAAKEAANIERERYTAHVDQLQKDLESEQLRRSELVQSYEAQVSSMNDERRSLHDIRKHAESLETELHDLTTKLTEKASELTAKEEELAKVQQELKQVSVARGAAKENLRKLQADFKALEERNKELEDTLAANADKAAKHDSVVGDLQKEIAALTQQKTVIGEQEVKRVRAECEERVHSIENELEAERAELHKLKLRAMKLESQLAGKQATIEEGLKNQSILQNRNEELEVIRSDLEATASKLQAEHSLMSQQLQARIKANTELMNRVADSNEACHKLEDELHTAQVQLSVQVEELANFRVMFAEAQSQWLAKEKKMRGELEEFYSSRSQMTLPSIGSDRSAFVGFVDMKRQIEDLTSENERLKALAHNMAAKLETQERGSSAEFKLTSKPPKRPQTHHTGSAVGSPGSGLRRSGSSGAGGSRGGLAGATSQRSLKGSASALVPTATGGLNALSGEQSGSGDGASGAAAATTSTTTTTTISAWAEGSGGGGSGGGGSGSGSGGVGMGGRERSVPQYRNTGMVSGPVNAYSHPVAPLSTTGYDGGAAAPPPGWLTSRSIDSGSNSSSNAKLKRTGSLPRVRTHKKQQPEIVRQRRPPPIVRPMKKEGVEGLVMGGVNLL